MPNPNAVVASVLRVELDAVELGNQRRLRLDTERREARGFGPILEGLRALRQPVYLEVDPATSTITRLLIPVVAHVVAVRPVDEGLDVQLDHSHARHVLRRAAPDSAEFERELREAVRSGRVMIVTGDETHTIIDVRGFTPGPDGDLPPLPPFPRPSFRGRASGG